MAVGAKENPTVGSQGATRKCRVEPTLHGRGVNFGWGTWWQGWCAGVVLNDIGRHVCLACTAAATLGMGLGGTIV